MKEQVLKVLLEHGTLIEPDAVDYILSRKDPVRFVRDLMAKRSEAPLILSLEDVRTTESVLDFEDFAEPVGEPAESMLAPEEPEAVGIATIIPPKTPKSSRIQEGLVIITDITGNSSCDGSIDNFTRYFRDRFTVLRRMIKSRPEMSGHIKIQNAKRVEREVKVIGMISDLGVTKNGHVSMTLEDDTGTMFALVLKDTEPHSETFLKDEVLGVVGRVSSRSGAPGGKGRSTMLIPEHVYHPDVQVNKPTRWSGDDVDVVFISDIHVGSKHFLPEPWKSFIGWLKTKEASKVRYMVVAGDLVDGIGVYPNQIDELDITTITGQYRELVELTKSIPKKIIVLLQPGNHDAVRPAEPQPALPDGLRASFGDNFRFIGNPCYFSMSGVEVLSYHGRSIDDLVGTLPNVSYQDPNAAMLEMLKRRHLAVSYGERTPLAPEAKDYMVINPVPDVFVTGHVHRTSVEKYRNITLISASAWQSQTPFQLMHNFHPDPGKAVLMSLNTGRCKVKSFYEKKKKGAG
jgi:DNA polymerase II small subunit